MSRRVGLWRRGSVGEFLKESRTAIEPPTALRRARQSCRSRFPETGRTMRCSSISAILLHEPLDNGGGLLRVLSQSRAEALVNGLPNAGAHCGITEHTARGAFEFRILQLHRHDGCQALANQLGAESGSVAVSSRRSRAYAVRAAATPSWKPTWARGCARGRARLRAIAALPGGDHESEHLPSLLDGHTP